ncbi:hypothetical protein BWI93_17585 [Siphonobacter sp. BAB-5385]|nr:hypothetical protein BWI93_17585 [Siphonobacter sp. BAB-5385]PMD98679.1 hypothetical protein BWI97_03895 [Siphonobacter sp. BAB-5405]
MNSETQKGKAFDRIWSTIEWGKVSNQPKLGLFSDVSKQSFLLTAYKPSCQAASTGKNRKCILTSFLQKTDGIVDIDSNESA